MVDSKAEELVKIWIRSSSEGQLGEEAEAEATKGLKLVKLDKGFLLCHFLVHNGVSDESGKWHEGAMATLMDLIGNLTVFSVKPQQLTTVYISLSFYSKPNLQEVVEIEGKVMEKKGRMTSVRVDVRRTKHEEEEKEEREMVAIGIMWILPAPSKNKPHKFIKPLLSKL